MAITDCPVLDLPCSSSYCPEGKGCCWDWQSGWKMLIWGPSLACILFVWTWSSSSLDYLKGLAKIQILVLDDIWNNFFLLPGILWILSSLLSKNIFFLLNIRIEKWEIKHKTYAADIARGKLNLFKCHGASFCHWATKYLNKWITLPQFNKPAPNAKEVFVKVIYISPSV